MALEHFPRAPITEAVLDIRVNRPDGSKLEALAEIGKQLAEEYPTRVDHVSIQQQIQTGPDGALSSHTTKTPLGYQFTSTSGLYVLQARIDGFSHHRMKPYENWDSFIAGAKRLWDTYREFATPMNITRVAIRFVNQVDLPMPVTHLDEYFRTGPTLASGVEAKMFSFFMRLDLIKPDTGRFAVVTQTTGDPREDHKTFPIILDIDVFTERVFSVDDPLIWEEFEALRSIRNEVFYSSITEKCKELFR